jgi:hypothetical protein
MYNKKLYILYVIFILFSTSYCGWTKDNLWKNLEDSINDKSKFNYTFYDPNALIKSENKSIFNNFISTMKTYKGISVFFLVVNKVNDNNNKATREEFNNFLNGLYLIFSLTYPTNLKNSIFALYSTNDFEINFLVGDSLKDKFNEDIKNYTIEGLSDYMSKNKYEYVIEKLLKSFDSLTGESIYEKGLDSHGYDDYGDDFYDQLFPDENMHSDEIVIEKKNKTNKWLIIFVVILILILIFLGYYFTRLRKRLKYISSRGTNYLNLISTAEEQMT